MNEKKKNTKGLFPVYSLIDSLKIAESIKDNNNLHPYNRIDLANSLNYSPNSSNFRLLIISSNNFGLSKGGYQADEISLTESGKSVVSPRSDQERNDALKNALFKIRLFKDFFTKFDQGTLPKKELVINSLNRDHGIPLEKCENAYKVIIKNAQQLGILKNIKGIDYIRLDILSKVKITKENSLKTKEISSEVLESNKPELEELEGNKPELEELEESIPDLSKKKRVFITHGKNKNFIEPIKKLLNFGELEAVVSVEKQSVSQPVPDKVMNDMRSCGAAIIHIDDEEKLVDKEAQEHIVINSNVLIEIGAAMALFGRRFILLVKEGITLPTNLQGLYEVRYQGNNLDGDITIKLLEAINEMKNVPLPEETTQQP